MKEKLETLIKELEDNNNKLTQQLTENPEMIWTYKSTKMSTKAVNLTIINKLKKILK